MRNPYDKSDIYQNYQKNLIKATVASNIGINNYDRLVKSYGTSANRIEILNRIRKQSKFTIYWFAIFIVLGIVCLFLDPSGWFNVFDLYFLMVNIYLVSRGKLIGIYVGVLECFVYAFICYKTQLYGEVIKDLCVLVPLNIYSIIKWTKSIKQEKREKYVTHEDTEDIVIKKLSTKQKILSMVSLFILSIGSYFLLKYAFNQSNALILSAIALAVSIISKILTAGRFMDSYAGYIASDIICLFMWLQSLLQTGLQLSQVTMIVYYLACITNDTYAYGLWKNMYRKVVVNGGVLLALRKVKINKIIKLRRQYQGLKWNKDVDTNKNS